MSIKYYDDNALSYFEKTVNLDMRDMYKEFLHYLEVGDKILDVGCGSGRDSKVFLDMGYDVTSIDGSMELARLASSYIGKEVIVKDFKQILYNNEFNGIWAMSSLLHLSKKDTLQVYKNLITSLKNNGVMYVCYKLGIGERIEKERFFNDYNEEQFSEFVKNNFDNITIEKKWLTQSQLASEEKFLNVLLKKKV